MAEDTAVIKAQNERRQKRAQPPEWPWEFFFVPCRTSLTLGRLSIWGVSLFIPVESAVSTINLIDVSGVAMMTLKTQMLALPC